MSSNDKGCCCFLPTMLAPVLTGLMALIVFGLSIIIWAYTIFMPAIAGIFLLPYVWILCERDAACPRILLIVNHIVEVLAVMFFAWMIVSLGDSETCSHELPQCEEDKLKLLIFEVTFAIINLFMLNGLWNFYREVLHEKNEQVYDRV